MTSSRRVAVPAAIAAGASLLVAHPPVGWWATSFLTAPLLVLSLRSAGPPGGDPGWGRTLLRAMALGALAGAVAYGPMIWWLRAPAGTLGWALLVGVQALWLGAWAVIVRPWIRAPAAPLIASATWTGMDAWRSLVPLGGFEWGAIAYAHADDGVLLPIARVLGARGITFAVVLIGMLVFVSGDGMVRAVRGLPRTPGSRGSGVPAGVASIVVAIALAAIALRAEPPPTVGSLDVLVVQPNDVRHWIAQVPDPPLHITTQARDLTLAAVRDGGRPDLIVWPESSVDRDPSRPANAVLGRLAAEAAATGGAMVAGASLDGPDRARERAIVALLLGPSGEVDRYVKRRLVPFGEYVPLRRWLGGLPGLEQVPRDAVPGPGPRSLAIVGTTRAAVAICFETLFTDIVRENVVAGPTDAGIVLAITNDASFREGAEPAQHLAQSRLRAVETGRWVVHGALSGSSAFVSPDGDVLDATGLFEATTIRREVPLAAGRTPYLVLGDLVGAVGRTVLVLAPIAVVRAVRRRRPDGPTRRSAPVEVPERR